MLSVFVSVSIVTGCSFTFPTLAPNFPILFNAIPQHNTISLSHFTVHAAPPKTLHITPCNMPSHSAMIHVCDTCIFIELQTYLGHLKCTIFSTFCVRIIYKFKYLFSRFLFCVFGLIILSCLLFLLILICRLFQSLFWCLGVNF